MKKNLITSILMLFLTAGTSALFAQSYLGIGGHGAFPQNALHKAGYDNGAGFHFSWMGRFKPLPTLEKHNFQLGVFSDVSFLGHRDFTVELNTPVPDNGKLRISNSSASFYGVFRNAWDFDKYMLYADFIIGPRGYYTGQTLTAKDPKKNPDYESVTTKSDVVITGKIQKGIAGGVMYKISKNVYIDLGFTYAMGPEGLVQPLKDVQQEGNEIRYTPKKIETDILLIRGSFIFKLNGMGRGASPSNNNNNNNYSTPDRQHRQTSPSRTTTTSPKTPKKSIEIKPNTTPTKKGVDH